MFFCSVQLSNLISRNFYYIVMQQYRYSNFSDVFFLNCVFVIDAAVKQLVSRSFLKYDVSVVTMAARKVFFSNQTFTVCLLVSLGVVPKRGSEWQGQTPWLSTWATQLRRIVAAAASRWLHCVRFDLPGN